MNHESFEAWVRGTKCAAVRLDMVGGRYDSEPVQFAWEGWQAAATAERERCKAWCQQVADHHRAQPDCSTEDDEEPTFRDGEACGAEDCVEAINLQGQWP